MINIIRLKISHKYLIFFTNETDNNKARDYLHEKFFRLF